MLNPADIRFKADGRKTARMPQIHIPLRLIILRPGSAQALGEARKVVDQLSRAVEDTTLPGGQLIVPDLDADEGQGVTELIIEQKSQREVRLQITLVLILRLRDDGRFWTRAAAIAAASDLLQGFALRPHEKGIEIEVNQARLLDSAMPATEPSSEANA
jgi:hypothetical protein